MSKTPVELLQDWQTLAATQGKKRAIECRTVIDEAGNIEHWAECENGRHRSKVSQEDALEELIDAHTEGAEDRAETRAGLVALGVKPEQAVGLLAKIGSDVKAANPKMPREDRDLLVVAAVAEVELQIQAEQAEKARLQAEREAKAAADQAAALAAREAARIAAEEAAAAKAAEEAATKATIEALVKKVADLEAAKATSTGTK